MAGEQISDLSGCSRFRQTVAARPPRIVHGAALLFLGLLVVFVGWAALVRANLVVRASGRVRSAEFPTRIFAPAFADLTGRVVEAPFDEGDLVRAGDTLARLDTTQIDNRLDRLQQTLAATDEEVRMAVSLGSLLTAQFAAAKAKVVAELQQAEAALGRAQAQRLSAVRSAQAEVHAAADVVQRMQRLRPVGAVTEEALVKAETGLRLAEEKLVTAEMPVDEGPVHVARHAVELVDRDFAVRRAEAEAHRAAKEGEAAALRRDVQQLEWQQAESVLRSPIDGVVVWGHVEPGDVLEPGKPIMEIAPRDGYRFEAAVSNEDFGLMQTGMPVRIKFDAYDYQRYGVMPGTVMYLSPDSRPHEGLVAGRAPGAAQPDRPAQFLVRIRMDSEWVGREEVRGAMKLGLGGTAEIITDRQSLLMIFLRKIRQSISLG